MDLVGVTNKAIEFGALQKPVELAALLQIVADLKPKVVVEIGTARGGTLYGLCRAAPDDALIVSIDLPGGGFGGGYSEDDEKTFLSRKKKNQRLLFLRQDSHNKTTLADLKQLVGGYIDFLLIDGDHTYKGVRKDFEMYSPLVRKGGLIVLHDILFHPHVPTCQVDKFWREIEERYDTKELIDWTDRNWGGIGVITYGDEKPINADDHKGLLLQLGRAVEAPKGFVTMADEGNIVQDFETFPWPIENDSVHICLAPHVVEHIKPWKIVEFFNEAWRIVKPGGQFGVSTPYAGSPAYWMDPTHCTGFNERSFAYFTPEFQDAFKRHDARPWLIEKGYPIWSCLQSVECLMRPIK